MSEENNKEFARKLQLISKELGHDLSLGHCYEILSRLAGYKSWNVASAEKVDLKAELPELNDDGVYEYELGRTNERSLKFSGWLIAESSSQSNPMHPNYSGKNGVWNEYSLYKTESGKFVCRDYQGTKWQGESPKIRAKVVSTNDEVVEFFGLSWLAKELYDRAEISYAEEVE